MIFDQNFRDKYVLGFKAPGEPLPEGTTVMADTIRELAEQTGIDPDALQDTVERYNHACQTGVDEEFGRGTWPWAVQSWGDKRLKPNPVMGPLDKPPFHALKLVRVGMGIPSAGLEGRHHRARRRCDGHPHPGPLRGRQRRGATRHRRLPERHRQRPRPHARLPRRARHRRRRDRGGPAGHGSPDGRLRRGPRLEMGARGSPPRALLTADAQILLVSKRPAPLPSSANRFRPSPFAYGLHDRAAPQGTDLEANRPRVGRPAWTPRGMMAMVITAGGSSSLPGGRSRPGPPELLLAVGATSVNRADLAHRAGRHDPGLSRDGPPIAGMDAAGTVIEVGPAVRDVGVGDRVMGLVGGGHAELALLDHRLAVPVPHGWTDVDAAAAVSGLLTQHHALVHAAGLRAGESVLVHGASAPVGLTAVQLAAFLGARPVLATARTGRADALIARAGADVVVHVAREPFVERVLAATGGAGVDVIVDHVGGPSLADSVRCLPVGGRLISVGRLGGEVAELDLEQLAFKQARIIGVTFRTGRSSSTRTSCGASSTICFPRSSGGACVRSSIGPIRSRGRWRRRREWRPTAISASSYSPWRPDRPRAERPRGQPGGSPSSTGSRTRASSRQSAAQVTCDASHTCSFHGWRSVAASMPASRARRRLSGLSSISRSMPSSRQRATLSSSQESPWWRRPMSSSQRRVAVSDRSARRLVMWMECPGHTSG